MTTIQIKHRWNGSVLYECELPAEVAGQSYGLQLGFAVKKALAHKIDLSGSDLSGSDLSGSNLRSSNLSGSDLSGSNLSGSDLRSSNLRSSDLSGSNLRSSNLSGSNLSGTDLRSSDLSGSNLSGSNLRSSNLSGSNLSGGDLSRSDWIPRIPNIHQAIFDAASKPYALDMGVWHCGTAHCRAGWVIALTADAGRVLEGCWGTSAAAAAIYMASDPSMERIPDFYATNTAALADMERLAKLEAAQP